MLKKISSSIFALALGVMALALPARAGNLPESIIPEGARWVAHLDMEKFVATRLFEFLEKDGRLEIKDRDITRMLKLDFFKDITGLTIFGLGPGEKQAVFLAAGRFDKKSFLDMFKLDDDNREIPYGGNTIYSTDDDEFGAFVNDRLIVFAEGREDVEKVLDTAAGKAKNFSSSGLSAAFKTVSAGAFLSGVFEDLADLDREIGESKLVGKAKGLFFLAQERQDTLEVRLQVTADSPESAKDMADVAQGLLAMARLSRNEDDGAGFAFLAEDAQVKLEGKTVRLELNLLSREAADLMSHGRGIAGLFD